MKTFEPLSRAELAVTPKMENGLVPVPAGSPPSAEARAPFEMRRGETESSVSKLEKAFLLFNWAASAKTM